MLAFHFLPYICIKNIMRWLIIFLFTIFNIELSAQCLSPSNTYASNINYYNVTLNWDTVSGSYVYKIRYKIIGATSWSYKNNIDANLNTKFIANLTPLSSYIWQIRTHCDSTNTNTSPWSVVDTFTTNTSFCPAPTGLNTTNITHNNALANWTQTQNANRYVIHYRIYGTSNWSNLANIDSTMTSKLIPLLQQNTTYEWQIMAYYDSTTQLASLWSISDTFTTNFFIPAPFNPIITNSISSNICNSPVDLLLELTQAQNEPDIGTSTITTNDGYFNISNLNFGDTIGSASLSTSTQTINTILKVFLIAGPNYAVVNSYDSSGTLIGFFAIENLVPGIRVTTTSPNDGNNYTSGLVSRVSFEDVFVTPNYTGTLNIFTELESELNHIINYIDSIHIQCVNNVQNIVGSKKLVKIVDLLGRETSLNQGHILYYIYSNGIVEKKIIVK